MDWFQVEFFRKHLKIDIWFFRNVHICKYIYLYSHKTGRLISENQREANCGFVCYESYSKRSLNINAKKKTNKEERDIFQNQTDKELHFFEFRKNHGNLDLLSLTDWQQSVGFFVLKQGRALNRLYTLYEL